MDKDKFIEVEIVETGIKNPNEEVKEEMEVQEVETKMVSKPTKHLEVVREQLDFTKLMEGAEMLSKSTIIPASYQRKPENCFVALDMASRMGLSPIVVMQNLFVIQGKPSWSGQAISAMIKSSPQFTDVELVYVGEEGKDSWGAYVKAKKKGKILKGGTVTIGTAKMEGWYQKAGSKWKSMPELMLAYRAFSWFGRVHAPELMMGLQSVEEVVDVSTETIDSEELNPFKKKVE